MISSQLMTHTVAPCDSLADVQGPQSVFISLSELKRHFPPVTNEAMRLVSVWSVTLETQSGKLSTHLFRLCKKKINNKCSQLLSFFSLCILMICTFFILQLFSSFTIQGWSSPANEASLFFLFFFFPRALRMWSCLYLTNYSSHVRITVITSL